MATTGKAASLIAGSTVQFSSDGLSLTSLNTVALLFLRARVAKNGFRYRQTKQIGLKLVQPVNIPHQRESRFRCDWLGRGRYINPKASLFLVQWYCISAKETLVTDCLMLRSHERPQLTIWYSIMVYSITALLIQLRMPQDSRNEYEKKLGWKDLYKRWRANY